jgi:hypothetical protein
MNARLLTLLKREQKQIKSVERRLVKMLKRKPEGLLMMEVVKMTNPSTRMTS